MEISMDTQGYDQTIANLDALPAAMAARVTGRGLLAAARVVRKRAREIVPVETGLLKKSLYAASAKSIIETSRGRRKLGGTAAVVGTRATAPHAHLVEFGTVRAPAHPFLGPAITGTTNAQLDALARETVAAMNKLAAQLAGPPEALPKSLRALVR